MHRRSFLQAAAALAAQSAARPALGGPARAAPDASAWAALGRQLGHRLVAVRAPLAEAAAAGGAGADALFAGLQNPYLLGDEPGLTQTLGWTGAWMTAAGPWAVAAESAADVAAAIRFARRHGVRLVVRGGAHSYFGNSNAADSLMIWTRPMRAITLHEAFRPAGAPASVDAVPAVSVGTGARWGEVYRAVAVEGGRYVQGGGCLTVGVAGFVLGGGFGSFSKREGTGAANLLEAEIVTADGRARVVNAYREPELFFALKGGGGGSFGVATRLTLLTHDLPATMGGVFLTATAQSDRAWRALVEQMLAFYAGQLFNPGWAEQIAFRPGRTLAISMTFQGLDEEEAKSVWAPFLDFVSSPASGCSLAEAPRFIALPGRHFWDPEQLRVIPGMVLQDSRAGAPADNVFWASNKGEAGQIIHSYQSAWLPQGLLAPDRRPALVDALVAASAQWGVSLHTNKGLAGGTGRALARTADTATNPAVLDAFALLISAASGPPAWPGIPGHEPDRAMAATRAAAVTRAMAPIRALVPDAGTYVSEADYFGAGWQQAYWGRHYPRLQAIKRRYDPGSLFRGHHVVEPG